MAVLVPTRDRATTALHAIGSFLGALDACGGASGSTIVVADDSGSAGERERLRRGVSDLGAAHGDVAIRIVATDGPRRRTVGAPGGGGGATRNRALSVLREIAPDADVVVMFDDDMSFSDAVYQGVAFESDGATLLRDAIAACATPMTVAGCGYSGRQDLSILEHARLAQVGSDDGLMRASTDRGGIENVAPGGISTAFLMLSDGPRGLPDFPEHYNEDYVWLDRLRRRGWRLVKLPTPMLHAPPGGVVVDAAGLSYQIFGEIVWLAVLEASRFRLDSADGMSAAVDEIAGDLRAALSDAAVATRPPIAGIVEAVLAEFVRVGREIGEGRPGPRARELLEAVRSGLRD